MGGIKFNESSIRSKCATSMKSAAVQSQMKTAGARAIRAGVGGKNGTVHTPEEAAAKFIEVLRSTIASSGLSAGAMGAVSEIDHTSAVPIGNDGTYSITVYFSGDASRPSLDEARYGGIDDIVLLFNNGVDHTMRPVHGYWHGEEVWSRTTIPGAHFIEQAVSDFMGNYATEYNVISIEPNLH